MEFADVPEPSVVNENVDDPVNLSELSRTSDPGKNVQTSSGDDPCYSPEDSTNEDVPPSGVIQVEIGNLIQEVGDADEYLRTIPTRHERSKIRHQAKKKAGSWHVPRSCKRCNQQKCAITRSGREIYHAHTLKAQKRKELLQLPLIKSRLKNLHSRRTHFEDIALSSTSEATGVIEEPWPSDVTYITENTVPADILFPDIGDGAPCVCEGDCFLDTCRNATMAIFCTPDCCRLKALCSNAPRSLPSLKLFDTRRVGLGFFTTIFLNVGDVLGEYAGKLCAYDAIFEGQPEQEMKQNSGYTMLLHTKTTNNKYVYIEALDCRFTTRFMSHSCRRNVAFMEMQNGTEVKVLAVMISDVNAGTELTVNYGDEIWFKCACDECWFRF